MGDIAFGREFSFIDKLTPDLAHEPNLPPHLISSGTSMFQYFTPVTWIGHIFVPLARYVPVITQKWNYMFKWAAEMCEDRRDKKSHGAKDAHEESTDAFDLFLHAAEYRNEHKALDLLTLYGDAFAVAVAGTHTAAAVLTLLCYQLSRQPKLQDELRDEIRAADIMNLNETQGVNLDVEIKKLEKLGLMNGCINEVMRIWSPLPSGGARQTAETGIKIGDTWIPPHTVVIAPRHTIGKRKY